MKGRGIAFLLTNHQFGYKMKTSFRELEIIMMRTKLENRSLPDYTRGEETFNMVSHIVGGGFGVIFLVLCVVRAAMNHNTLGLVGSVIYGTTMILLYSMSSIYHGLHNGTAKKVFQVLDHCTIYLLIAGTYTVLGFGAISKVSLTACWVLFGLEWGMTALAVTLTAIDLKQYEAFSMVCYIAMGWVLIVVYPLIIAALGMTGFWYLVSGGIAYTIGAVLYGIGSKMRYMHSLFHLFVLLGSLLHFWSIFAYSL